MCFLLLPCKLPKSLKGVLLPVRFIVDLNYFWISANSCIHSNCKPEASSTWRHRWKCWGLGPLQSRVQRKVVLLHETVKSKTYRLVEVIIGIQWRFSDSLLLSTYKSTSILRFKKLHICLKHRFDHMVQNVEVDIDDFYKILKMIHVLLILCREFLKWP